MVRRQKRIILYILVIIVIIFLFKVIPDDSKIDMNKENKKENNNFVIALKIGGSVLSYDREKNIFYTNLSNPIVSINVISPYKTSYKLEKISEEEYDIDIYSSKLFMSSRILVTDFPLISIHTLKPLNKYLPKYNVFDFENHELVDEEKKIDDISLDVLDNNYFNHNQKKSVISSSGVMYVRGATSRNYPKKSYRLILENKESLLGMRREEDWILDALYTDKSNIRNKFSSDLWNTINNNQYIDNDILGHFVEVFIDDRYQGLYVLKEKVNKKITNVGSNGLLGKLIDHINQDSINDFTYSGLDNVFKNDDDLLGNIEIKYCTSSSLKEFFLKMKKIYTYKNYEIIDENFYMDNYINYKLFILFISGVDNVTKNQYYSMIDDNSKILITPWDMDLTWGLSWSDNSELHSVFSMESSNDINWVNNSIVNDMDEKTIEKFKERYWELRRNVITMDTINSYLDSYKDILVNSGAAKRDSERWYEYDVENEIEAIREWAGRRIQFLDEYFS